jgi:hypothetical protein
MIAGGISCGISLESVRPVMETLPPTLLHLPKSGIVLHRTLFLDEIQGNPQKPPDILQLQEVRRTFNRKVQSENLNKGKGENITGERK